MLRRSFSAKKKSLGNKICYWPPRDGQVSPTTWSSFNKWPGTCLGTEVKTLTVLMQCLRQKSDGEVAFYFLFGRKDSARKFQEPHGPSFSVAIRSDGFAFNGEWLRWKRRRISRLFKIETQSNRPYCHDSPFLEIYLSILDGRKGNT